MSNGLLLENEVGVLTVTLDRPKVLNAIDGPLQDALMEVISKAARESTVRCLVLTGAGRGFSAGGDTTAIAKRDANAARDEDWSLEKRKLRAVAKP